EPGGPSVDTARFAVELPRAMSDAAVHIRYRCDTGGPLRVRGMVDAALEPQPAPRTEVLHCGYLPAGTHELVLSVGEGDRALVDVVVVAENADAEAVRFAPVEPAPTPRIERADGARFADLSFPDLPGGYRVRWSGANCVVREILNAEVDSFLPAHVNEHVAMRLRGDVGWHFTDFYMHPILVGGHASATVRFEIAAADSAEPPTPAKDDAPAAWRAGGEAYAFSQRLMRAVVLTNVVYPIPTRYGYVKHYTPGKWWDSLYTWDSGFTALGLLEIDAERAEDCLSAYLTGPEEADSLPFLLHGTPLPIQIIVARELWNRHSDVAQLRRLYPGLRRMYDYVCGRSAGSPTQPFAVPLLTTWKLFYNSGGWDDYPAQRYVHRHGLTDSVAPVVTTAIITRCAKLLASLASLLGLDDEKDVLLRDAQRFERALQEHAYDPETGYFGYVRFDETGCPAGILRSENGENLNRGLDGITPLVAGVLDRQQLERVFSLLSSDRHLWTDIGISTVDRSASYFRRDGYWNGAVWMPHQWLLWKSLIDYGRFDLIVSIAQIALELWERETGDSYNCYEHFIIESGRGAGWHQFGGLSTPVLAFFNALYRIGRVTPGYDVRIDQSSYDDAADSLTISVVNEAVGTRWILLSMARDAPRSVRSWGAGRELAPHLRTLGDGLYGIGLPGGFRGDLELT
ncbi:MAG: MGH1-like glycoside hydrolase domain-containing protein, partial [Spirochaetota bacterium]